MDRPRTQLEEGDVTMRPPFSRMLRIRLLLMLWVFWPVLMLEIGNRTAAYVCAAINAFVVVHRITNPSQAHSSEHGECLFGDDDS